MIEEFKKTYNDNVFGNDFEALVADARYKYISKNFAPTLTKKNKDKIKMSRSDKRGQSTYSQDLGYTHFPCNTFLGIPLNFLRKFIIPRFYIRYAIS